VRQAEQIMLKQQKQQQMLQAAESGTASMANMGKAKKDMASAAA